jgi:16S rRNA processing protein RimM
VTWDEMAVVGRIARAHGIRGQVIVNLETDFPHERFQAGAEVFVERRGRVEPLVISSVRFQHDRPVIGVEGVDDMNAATALAGLELRVPREQLMPLPEHVYYRHELVGCAVETEDGVAVGTVSSVEGELTGSRLVVATPAGDALVPLVADICRVIDPQARRIVIAPPAGLLELNVLRRRETDEDRAKSRRDAKRGGG